MAPLQLHTYCQFPHIVQQKKDELRTENITCEKRDWYKRPIPMNFPHFAFFFRLARGSTMYMNCVWYVNGWQSCRVVIAGVVWLVGFVWSENGFGIGVMIITVITIHWFPIYNGNVVVDVIIGILMRHFSVVWMRSVCVCVSVKEYVCFCFTSMSRLRGRGREREKVRGEGGRRQKSPILFTVNCAWE